MIVPYLPVADVVNISFGLPLTVTSLSTILNTACWSLGVYTISKVESSLSSVIPSTIGAPCPGV